MNFKLKNWQKFILILSFVWAVGMSLYLYAGFNSVATGAGESVYQNCLLEQKKSNRADPSICIEQQVSTRDIVLGRQWQNIAKISLVPILFFWLFGYVLRRVVLKMKESKASKI
jgi:hypothetical protein